MRASRRLLLALATLAAITAAGTVGYGEVHPLGPAGKLSASGLIVVGVGASLYLGDAVARSDF